MHDLQQLRVMCITNRYVPGSISNSIYTMQFVTLHLLALACFAAAAPKAAASVSNVIIGGLGRNSSIALAQLDLLSGQLVLQNSWQSGGPSPAFIAWSSPDETTPTSNFVIANHAGASGEAMTALQLLPPYAKQAASVKLDDPAHIAVHPSSSPRWALTAAYDAGTVGVVELLPSTGPAVEVSRTAPAAAASTAAAATAHTSLILPPELQLGRARTVPTELVGQAAHEVRFSPDGQLVYVPCLKSDWVRMYKFDAASGTLSPNSYPSTTAATCSKASNESQSTSSSSNTTSSNSTGAAVSQNVPAATSGTAAVDAPVGSAANNVVDSAGSVLGSSAGTQAVCDGSTGDNRALLPPGSGPRHLVCHPTLPVAYVLNELSSTIARFDWDLATGGHLIANFTSEPGRIVSMLPPGRSTAPVCLKHAVTAAGTMCKELCSPQAGAELAVSSDGRFLYASNRGLCDGVDGKSTGISDIVVFSISSSNGELQPLAWEAAGGDVNVPRHFSLTPDASNAYLLVANLKGESVTVLRRDASTGLLSKVVTVPTLPAGVQQPSFVSVIQ